MSDKKLQHHTPHDAYVRKIFESLDIAKDYFQNSLPEEIVKDLNWETLKSTEKTFIHDDLKQHITDILFRIDVQGQPGYIYLLMEHMSTQNKWLPYRMLQYVMSVMEYHKQNVQGAQSLPVVIPCLLYTGHRSFKHSLNIMDLFGDQKALAEKVMFKPPHLMDMSQISDENLRQKYHRFCLGALLLKHIRDPDTTYVIQQVSALMHNLWENGYMWYIKVSLNYIIQAGHTADLEKFKAAVARALPELEENEMKTISEMFNEADCLRAERRGEARGEARGQTIGEANRNIAIAQYMLTKGYSVDEIMDITNLTREDIIKLRP